MQIGGLQKSTLLDFPSKIACIVFTQGCNFRCGYCHNPELFKPKEPLSIGAFFDFLKTRVKKLDGVVITGGEPTLHADLPEFIKEIKKLSFDIKLDTNGTNPTMLEKLFEENLLDYVAMDIKAPFEKYNEIVCVDFDLEKIKKSIELVKNSKVEYEFRTTVLKNQLNEEDFKKIGEMIKGAKRYYLQGFIPSKILDEKLKDEKTYSSEEFLNIKNMMLNFVDFCDVR